MNGPPTNPAASTAGQRADAERETPTSACCAPDEQATCCEPSAKAACCGDATATGRCGCR